MIKTFLLNHGSSKMTSKSTSKFVLPPPLPFSYKNSKINYSKKSNNYLINENDHFSQILVRKNVENVQLKTENIKQNFSIKNSKNSKNSSSHGIIKNNSKKSVKNSNENNMKKNYQLQLVNVTGKKNNSFSKMNSKKLKVFHDPISSDVDVGVGVGVGDDVDVSVSKPSTARQKKHVKGNLKSISKPSIALQKKHVNLPLTLTSRTISKKKKSNQSVLLLTDEKTPKKTISSSDLFLTFPDLPTPKTTKLFMNPPDIEEIDNDNLDELADISVEGRWSRLSKTRIETPLLVISGKDIDSVSSPGKPEP
jgi:hypothetical protein